MRVVLDSHAIIWYVQGSARLSRTATTTITDAEQAGELVVSVATFLDLWYVTQTTQAVTADQLRSLRDRLTSSEAVTMEPVNLAVADAWHRIPRTVLADPWDRLIVATAMALQLPLVSKDEAIHQSGLVAVVW